MRGKEIVEDIIEIITPQAEGRGLKIDYEPCQEDWGWEVFVTCDGKRFFIGIGPYELDGALGWLCFVESRLPSYKKLMGATDASEQQRVCVAFHSVLASAPEIRDIRWHSKESFTKGNEADWKPEPGKEIGVPR
jgi:hypothetical protein